MAKVTVGVPVYNGAEFLEESLECLRQQDFTDIEVIIHDNASTDDTPLIAQRFCQIDSRFKYMRRPKNVGFLQNFLGLLNEAKSPYFFGRAHDDISSPNWVSELVAAFERDPRAILAISRVRIEHPDGTEHRTVPAPLTQDRASADLARELLKARCFAWFWCMWRREPLLEIMRFTAERYSNPWGLDMVTLFPVSVSGRATSSDAATFYSRVNPRSVSQTMLKKADLSFQWSYQHAFKRHIWEAFAAFPPADLPQGIGRDDVKKHIRTIVGKRKFFKNFFKQPRSSIAALYACYAEDFSQRPRSVSNAPTYQMSRL
jgi:glycosyltransferase involved in cell wall biosynthesis